MENHAPVAAKPGALSSSENSVQSNTVLKPEGNVHDREPNNANTKAANGVSAVRLRRFPLRALFLITIPPAICVYFIVVENVLTTPDPDTAPYGHRNATWVFYSWFLLGVFGLGASNYGLEGAEAAMAENRFWAPRNALVLSMHSEKSWTGLSGWVALGKALMKGETRDPRRLIGRLWVLLAVLSLAVYIALPLSGLAMELSDGYIKASGHPLVLGRTFENFNARQKDQELVGARAAWIGGAPMTLPGASVLYTSPGIDRSKDESLKELPNALPSTDGLVDVFFAPQATNLVRGDAWGLRIGYKCEDVKSVSEFTILSQRNSDLYQYPYSGSPTFTNKTFGPWNGYGYSNNTFLTPNNQTITFWNSGPEPYAENVWAYGETGEIPFFSDGYEDITWRNASTFDDEGLRRQGSVIEMALWQIRINASYEGAVKYDFNETVTPSIADMGSPFFLDGDHMFALNNSFFPKNLHQTHPYEMNISSIADAANQSLYVAPDNIRAIAPPIGIRCLYQYAPGYAYLNPESATFNSFKPTTQPPKGYSESPTPPFGITASRMISHVYYDMFTANGGAAPIVYSNSRVYTTFLQPQVLLGSVMRAFAMDVLQLMYDGANSFTGAYEHQNLTATQPGKILGPGAVPPLLVTILFCIWAAGCVVIGVMYGFRRRRAETLVGANFAEEIRSQDVAMHKHPVQSEGLTRIPGMAGDNENHTGLANRFNRPSD